MEIRYVPWGLANNFGDYIEINENLKQYPELHDAILEHELGHTDKPGFNKKDFLLDLGPTKVNYWKLLRFMCIYPKTFLQFAPIYKQGKTFFYDINMIIVWSFMILGIGAGIFFVVG